MTKTEFLNRLKDRYQYDARVATLIKIILNYGQGEDPYDDPYYDTYDDPSDMYIKRLVATIDFDWGTDTSRDIYNMIKRVYPHIEFPESLV